MGVVISNGVGYGSESGAMYIDMAATMDTAKSVMPAAPIVDPIPTDSMTSVPWSPWGSNNILPLEMIADIKSCNLYAMIEGRSRLAFCQGIVPVQTKIDSKTGQRVIDKYVDDAEINDWMEMNNLPLHVFGWIKDYVCFLRCTARIMLNKKKDKIASIKRDDVTRTRMEKVDGYSRIRNIWYSVEWNKARTADSKKCFSVPLLDTTNPLLDLTNRLKRTGAGNEYAMMVTHPGWDEVYYPVPLWMSALKWIKIAAAIPEMKAAIYENMIRAKMVVVIYETFWEKRYGQGWDNLTEKEKNDFRNKVYDDIEKFLVGAKNAGKAIFVHGYRDRDGKTYGDVEFKPVDDVAKNGEYLPDAAQANSEIAFSLLWNNALTGGNQKNSLYSQNEGGSNVREASTLQVIITEIERIAVKSLMNSVKHFNGWSQRLPGLDFIIPATILTTLDTGAGSKPVVTGNTKTKEDAAD